MESGHVTAFMSDSSQMRRLVLVEVHWVDLMDTDSMSVTLPPHQFALWVDAVIFVFSLEDESSFQTVYHYFSRLAAFRNATELPLVLVGTQGTHTQGHPVFEDILNP